MRPSLHPALLLIASVAAPAAAQRLDYSPVEDEALAAGPRLGYRQVEGDTAPARPGLQWGLLDRFEYAVQSGRDGYAWDFSALYGGERHRLWLGTSGEGAAWAVPDYVELNAAYSYHLGGAWDLNAGFRHDLQTGPDRSYLQIGGQYDDGSALWFGGWAYLSHKGELSARLAGYYNQKLAGALIVQPSAELDYYGEDMPELGIGRGFGYAEAGLRLRYEMKEAFAPYVGLSWSRDLGRTARMTRAEGEDPETRSVVMGVRSSF